MKSKNLPVGISLTTQYNNRYQRERDFPEDRHPAYTAHIGFRGGSWARNFRIDMHASEEDALDCAIRWRVEMVRQLTRSCGDSPMHARFNRAGIRRPVPAA